MYLCIFCVCICICIAVSTCIFVCSFSYVSMIIHGSKFTILVIVKGVFTSVTSTRVEGGGNACVWKEGDGWVGGKK